MQACTGNVHVHTGNKGNIFYEKRFQCEKSVLHLPRMDEKLGQILSGAASIFLRYGIKSLTMDDIARELSISKKTLYKYVDDKNDLVKKVMEAFVSSEQHQCGDILGTEGNAIDKLIAITRHVAAHFRQIHPSIHYDLERHYPEAWNVFNDHRKIFICDCISGNLRQGKEEGLYRENVNADIIAKIYIAKIDCVFDSDVFPPGAYNFEQVYMEMMRYHIRGVASEKGIEYLTEKIKQEQINLL